MALTATELQRNDLHTRLRAVLQGKAGSTVNEVELKERRCPITLNTFNSIIAINKTEPSLRLETPTQPRALSSTLQLSFFLRVFPPFPMSDTKLDIVT